MSLADTLASSVGTIETVDLRGGGEPTELLGEAARYGGERYLEIREIGRGGLGQVIEAFDRDLRRRVALKRTVEDRREPANLSALVREAQITAQLEHPNVPAIHSLEVDEEGMPFFTMTRLGGTSLTDLIREQSGGPEAPPPLTLARKLRIFLQVGYAVAFAHSRGVLHRDLKPDNVIVGEFGEVRLIDWGVAKLIDAPDEPAEELSGSRLPVTSTAPTLATREGQFVGTPGYASPEQVNGELGIDERSDVYGLGAILYELVSGRRPVSGKTALEVMLKTVEGQVTPLNEVAPVSTRLAAVVHKALALKPEDRYGSALEMLHDVEALLDGRPVRAHSEGVLERFGKWYGGRPPQLARLKLWHIDFAVFLGMFLGVAGGIWLAPSFGQGWWRQVAIILSIVISVLGMAPMFYTIARKERFDDPGIVLPLLEGVSTSASTRVSPHRPPSHESTRAEGRGGPQREP